MTAERTSAALLLLCGLVIVVLAGGCGSSSPEVGRAEAAMSGRDYESAMADVERALERDSTNTEAYLLKAELLRQKADSTMAPEAYIDLYRQAHATEDKAVSLDRGLRDDVYERRRRVYDREIQRAESAYNRGSKDENKQLFRYAIGYFGAASATMADSARPALNEAYARLQVGQKKDAIPVLERYVARTDTAEVKPLKILGQLYVSTGAFDRAVTLLDRAVVRHPAERDLQALRLNAYNQLGDVDEALAAYREEVEAMPERPGYRYNYGALLLKARRYDAAIEQLRQAVDLRPDNAEGQYNLGAAYLNAALVRDDSIATIEQNPEAYRDSVSSATDKLSRLVEKRQTLFENAIPPLERARKLVEEDRILRREGAATLRTDACRALLVAYVQTKRPNKAAEVEDCTGLAQAAPLRESK